jgi:transcriptional regulator with XRE-family HTH domain
MSGRTRFELQKLKRKLKSAGVLADKSNVSRAALSRILSGKTRPSARTVFKLSSSLDIPTASQLIAAYLSDEIPENMRRHVRVEVRLPQDKRWMCADRFCEQVQLLPVEQRQLVENLVYHLLRPNDPNTPILYMNGCKEPNQDEEGGGLGS